MKLYYERPRYLAHVNGFKYLSRKWVKDKWVYKYPDDSKSKKTNIFESVKDKVKDVVGIDEKERYRNAKTEYNSAVKSTINIAEDQMLQTEKKEKQAQVNARYKQAGIEYVESKKEYLKTPIAKIDKVSESVKKFVEDNIVGQDMNAYYKQLAKEEEEQRLKEQRLKAYEEKKANLLETIRDSDRWQFDQKIEDLIYNGPLPELDIKTRYATRDEDQAAVNPNYNRTDPNVFMNCAYCAIAYDLRRRGYDVAAMEAISELNVTEIAELYDEQFLNADNREQDQEQIVHLAEVVGKDWNPDNPEDFLDFEDHMKSMGEGARGIFVVYWKVGSAHGVSWEIENGELVIRDAQTNERHDIDDYFGRIENMMYIRTDNLTPNKKVLKYVKST